MVEFFLDFALSDSEFVIVGIRFSEGFVDLIELFEEINNLLHTFFNNLLYGLVGIELRFLLQHSYRVTGRKHNVAVVVFIDTGNNAE